jgi:hypothetical protein
MLRYVFAFLLFLTAPLSAQQFYVPNYPHSLDDISGFSQSSSLDNDYVNYIKFSLGWRNASGFINPANIDQNGTPLNTTGSPQIGVGPPNAAERPGDYVLSWAGSAKVELGPGAFTQTVQSCTGVTTSSLFCDNTSCSGMQGYIAGTTLFVTASPSVATSASCFPSGGLLVGQPISNNSAISSGTYNSTTGAVSLTVGADLGIGPGATIIVTGCCSGTTTGPTAQIDGTFTTTAGTSGTTINFTAPAGLGSITITSGGQVQSTTVSKFGTPTIISAQGTNSGGPCSTGSPCQYTVNFSQTIGSSGDIVNLYPGGRFEVTPANLQSTLAQLAAQGWNLTLTTTTAGNPLQWAAFYHVNDLASGGPGNDESDYINGLIIQNKFKTVMKAANFATFRDLGPANNLGNQSSLWATRKPSTYSNWTTLENRPSIYAGTMSYNLNGAINQYYLSWNGGVLYNGETIIVTPANTAVAFGSSSVNISSGTYNSTTGQVVLTLASPTPLAPGIGNVAVSGITGTNASSFNGTQLSAAGTVGSTLVYYVATGLGNPTFNTGAVAIQSTSYAEQLSIDGGTTYYPVFSFGGANLYPASGAQFQTARPYQSLVWLANLNAWVTSSVAGLENDIPPEVFAELCYEAGVNPWIIQPIYATDPITDYLTSYASYIKTNYPTMHPWFEVSPNETWNTAQFSAGFATQQALVWQTHDPVNWASNNSNALWDQEVGHLSSLAGQALATVYSNPAQYEVVVGVATVNASSGFIAGSANNRLTASAFVNQTFAAQAGFVKAPAYNYAHYIAIANYWYPYESDGNNQNTGPPQLTADAYNYFYGNSSAQTTIMNGFGATAVPYIAQLSYYEGLWANWANYCGTGTTSRPSSCVVKGYAAYEGGNSTGGNLATGNTFINTDISSLVTGANNTSTCALTMKALGTATGSITNSLLTITAGGGFPVGMGVQFVDTATGGTNLNVTINGYAVQPTDFSVYTLASGAPSSFASTALTGYGLYAALGMPVTLSNVVESGGTSWAALAAAGNLTVGPSPTAQSVPLLVSGSTLNCSAYDTLTSAKLTYTGSTQWINVMLAESYFWRGLYGILPTVPGTPITGTDYTQFFTNGGVNPAQSNFSNNGPPWNVSFFDIYQFYPEGTCTACTVSGTTLTLGGTITGMFKIGDVVWGECMTNPVQTSTPTCTANNASGANPQTTIVACISCSSPTGGIASGDTLTLSQTQNASLAGSFPAIAFIHKTQGGLQAIQLFNGGYINQNYLLKRDLDPASNDNTPAWVYKAA